MTEEFNALSTNGSGVIAPIFKFDPSGFSAWSTIAVEYDEYRVIGCRIKFYSVNPTGLDGGPFAVVYDDDDDTTGITAFVDALDYRVKKMFPIVWNNSSVPTLTANCWDLADPATGVPWLTTANASATRHSFKGYGANLSYSAAYLCATLELVVQFRGPV